MSNTLPQPPSDEVESVRDVLRTLKRESPSYNSRRATLEALGIPPDAPVAKQPAAHRPPPKVIGVLVRWLIAGVILGLAMASLLRWLAR